MLLLQIDSLDTLALLGDREHFTASVEWIGKNLQFDIVSEMFFLHQSFVLIPLGLYYMEILVWTLIGLKMKLYILGLDTQTDLKSSLITLKTCAIEA